MKVLTLTQPFAQLIFLNAKLIETRSWKVSNPDIMEQIKREGILIHAGVSKSYGKGASKVNCRELCYKDPFNEFINGGRGYDELPMGAIIGKVSFHGCYATAIDTDRYILENWRRDQWRYERHFGDYSPGRYGWTLSNPVLFKTPIPAKGQLNLWDYDMPDHLHQ